MRIRIFNRVARALPRGIAAGKSMVDSEFFDMTVARDAGQTSDTKAHGSAKKEWRQPSLRKLPIAATAGRPGKSTAGNEGNTSKNGDANTRS
jgi:hypothetical protein